MDVFKAIISVTGANTAKRNNPTTGKPINTDESVEDKGKFSYIPKFKLYAYIFL